MSRLWTPGHRAGSSRYGSIPGNGLRIAHLLPSALILPGVFLAGSRGTRRSGLAARPAAAVGGRRALEAERALQRPHGVLDLLQHPGIGDRDDDAVGREPVVLEGVRKDLDRVRR